MPINTFTQYSLGCAAHAFTGQQVDRMLFYGDTGNERAGWWSIQCTSTTDSPTQQPSSSPTTPSTTPTKNPSAPPSVTPTKNPSASPTVSPSQSPIIPTSSPSKSPSTPPSKSPSLGPTTESPSVAPSTSPTKAPTGSPPVCGNEVCELGEDCNDCAADCPGKAKGKPQTRFCCFGTDSGVGCTGDACSDTSCDTGGNPPPPSVCNANGVCEEKETCQNCPEDCPGKPKGRKRFCCEGQAGGTVTCTGPGCKADSCN